MPIDAAELGRRLRAAREARGLKQDDIAAHLGVSRPTITQIELGNRAISSLELDALADLYACDIRELLAERSAERDPLLALFRLEPDTATQESMVGALRDCLAIGRELGSLEELLRIDRDATSGVTYALPLPRNRWEAIEQGERLARDERHRLDLGLGPLPDLIEVLEEQGLRTAQVDLPDEISGLTVVDPTVGILVAVNRGHPLLRRRFSMAHEYCHALVDRDRAGIVSRSANRDELIEVRANVFAANFLLPEEGVRQVVHGLAKGRPSRMQADVFDGDGSVVAEARSHPGTQDLQLHDIVWIAHRFRVSRETALYRCRNLKLITRPRLDVLLEQDRRGLGKQLELVLGIRGEDPRAARNAFRSRLVGLGLEAFRREEISAAKLRELAGMVGVKQSELDRLLDQWAGFDPAIDTAGRPTEE